MLMKLVGGLKTEITEAAFCLLQWNHKYNTEGDRILD